MVVEEGSLIFFTTSFITERIPTNGFMKKIMSKHQRSSYVIPFPSVSPGLGFLVVSKIIKKQVLYIQKNVLIYLWPPLALPKVF